MVTGRLGSFDRTLCSAEDVSWFKNVLKTRKNLVLKSPGLSKNIKCPRAHWTQMKYSNSLNIKNFSENEKCPFSIYKIEKFLTVGFFLVIQDLNTMYYWTVGWPLFSAKRNGLIVSLEIWYVCHYLCIDPR